MRDYQKQVVSDTSGRGRLFCNPKGYAPCKNQEAVVQSVGYDSEHDLENPAGSVFCAHGAGFVVPWDQVEEYMHLDSGIDTEALAEESESWYELSEEDDEVKQQITVRYLRQYFRKKIPEGIFL